MRHKLSRAQVAFRVLRTQDLQTMSVRKLFFEILEEQGIPVALAGNYSLSISGRPGEFLFPVPS